MDCIFSAYRCSVLCQKVNWFASFLCSAVLVRKRIISPVPAASAAQMDAACDEALKQIVDKGYAKTIEPGYEKILCYGIAFYQKSVMIKKL